MVFDRYLDQSLKNKTRQKRAATSTGFEIHPEMKLTMSLKEILSASRTKSSLRSMFAQGLLEQFPSNSIFKLIVVYDTNIKGHDFEEDHSHQEADTLIPHQVLASLVEGAWREICVCYPTLTSSRFSSTWSLVVALELTLVSSDKGTKYRDIDVVGQVRVIGRHKCEGLIGLHYTLRR